MKDVNLWFAKNDCGELVTIDRVDKEYNGEYYCPICGSNVKAVASNGVTKQGRLSKRAAHFAHVDASKCSSEARIHWWFKHKFIEKGDKFTVNADTKHEYMCKSIEVERSYEVKEIGKSYIPDVTVKTECGNTIFFEIKNTNGKKISECLDLWAILGNTVVEVGVRDLIDVNSNGIREFKALFYDGKCFSIKKGDIYYNTIGKHKEELLGSGVTEAKIEAIKRLDWFWDDVVRYKTGDVKIDDVSNMISVLDEDEKCIVFDILKKPRCSCMLDDFLNFKKIELEDELEAAFGHKEYKVVRYKNSVRVYYRNRDVLDIDAKKLADVRFIVRDKHGRIQRNESQICIREAIDDIKNKASLLHEDASVFASRGYGYVKYIYKMHTRNTAVFYFYYDGIDVWSPREKLGTYKIEGLWRDEKQGAVEYVLGHIEKEEREQAKKREDRRRREIVVERRKELLVPRHRERFKEIKDKIISILKENHIEYLDNIKLSSDVESDIVAVYDDLLSFNDGDKRYVLYNRKCFHHEDVELVLCGDKAIDLGDIDIRKDIYMYKNDGTYCFGNIEDLRPEYKKINMFKHKTINVGFGGFIGRSTYLKEFNFVDVAEKLEQLYFEEQVPFVHEYKKKLCGGELKMAIPKFCGNIMSSNELDNKFKLLISDITRVCNRINGDVNIKLNINFTRGDGGELRPWLIRDFVDALEYFGVNFNNVK